MARSLTENDFYNIKNSLGDGMTVREVHESLGWSEQTIQRVKQVDTFEGHLKKMHEKRLKFLRKKYKAAVAPEAGFEEEVQDRQPTLIDQLRVEQAAINAQFESIIATLSKLEK